jgi:hypothetical protein
MNVPKSPLNWIVLNVVSLIFALILNFLAVSLPINNKTTGELSDSYPNLFVPSGFTFSIWGIIYLLMIIFLVYQVWQYRQNEKQTIQNVLAIGPWFFISGLANGLWILAWHYEYVFLSLCIMLVIFYSLLKIYLILDQSRPHTLSDNLAIRVFFSVYLGWISVATIANVTTLLVSNGWVGVLFGESTWAIILVIIATILGILMIFKKQDLIYPLVIIWAFYGIYVKQMSGMANTSTDVAKAAQYAMTMLIIYTVLNLVGKRAYFFEKK